MTNRWDGTRFVSAGLKADEEGDDFELIQELIDPPKQLGVQVNDMKFITVLELGPVASQMEDNLEIMGVLDSSGL